MTNSPPSSQSTPINASTDYYNATSHKNTPSPMIVFPASSPTPKLSCHSPSKKPTSPFDWAYECFLSDQQEALSTSDWDYHFGEMERIGKELERDSLALERLREKANPTPEECCVLSWIDSSSPNSPLLSKPRSPLASSSSCHNHDTSFKSLTISKEEQRSQRQEKPASHFLAFLNRFKKSFKLQ